MEVHQLRYFCAVSETGSFTRAAEKEQVAQPSLSQQIMKLEEELGVRLFDRLGRTVRLTGFGQVFLPRARAILGELKAAKEEVAERQSAVWACKYRGYSYYRSVFPAFTIGSFFPQVSASH